METASVEGLEEEALEAAQKCRSLEEVKSFIEEYGNPLKTGIDRESTRTIISFAGESAIEPYLERCKKLSEAIASSTESYQSYKADYFTYGRKRDQKLTQYYRNVLYSLGSEITKTRERFLQEKEYMRTIIKKTGLEAEGIDRRFKVLSRPVMKSFDIL
jgi:hypothetical protein